jgi:hypothetical protein
MKKIFYTILIFIFCGASSSQAQYNLAQNAVWPIDRYSGLKFSGSSNPAPITTAAHAYVAGHAKGMASVASGEGHLLFYSNGYTVWDSAGNVMPHGDSLSPTTNVYSHTQPAVIVPFINQPGLYYLFTIHLINTTLKCNVINMSLNNGLGDIDTLHPANEQVLDSFVRAEILTVSGCNNNVWLIVKKHPGSNASLKAIEITQSGINPVPVISPTATSGSNFGLLKVNPQRTKIFEGGAVPTLYDFNPNTGVISNGFLLAPLSGLTFLGGEFSADGTKLYCRADKLYQYNLNAADIPASKFVIANGSGTTASQQSDLRLAPDQKIYTRTDLTGVNDGRYMARINNPNNLGFACNYQDSVPGLVFSAPSVISPYLPTEIWIPFQGGTTSGQIYLDTLICNYTNTVLNAAPGQTQYLWDNGTTGTSRSINQPGTYWVKYTTQFCNKQVDTYKVHGVPTLPLLIVQNGNVLSTTNMFNSYQWYRNSQVLTGATGPTLIITGNAVYSVKAGNNSGCTDSVSYTVTNSTAINNLYSPGGQIYIYPNPATDYIKIHSAKSVTVTVSVCAMDGRTLVKGGSDNKLDISHLSQGIYLVKITDKNGWLIATNKLVKQ